MPENRLKSRLLPFLSINEPRCRAILRRGFLRFIGIAVFCSAVILSLIHILMLRYYAAPILSVADEEMDASEAIHMSCVIYKRTMLDFIYLFFSFAGWLLLSLTAVSYTHLDVYKRQRRS